MRVPHSHTNKLVVSALTERGSAVSRRAGGTDRLPGPTWGYMDGESLFEIFVYMLEVCVYTYVCSCVFKHFMCHGTCGRHRTTLDVSPHLLSCFETKSPFSFGSSLQAPEYPHPQTTCQISALRSGSPKEKSGSHNTSFRLGVAGPKFSPTSFKATASL